MRLVRQDDTYGCGLACVAMVAGTTYAAVRRTYLGTLEEEPRGRFGETKLDKLREIMRQHGVALIGRGRWVGRNKRDQLGLPFDALVRMNVRQDGWHWAIWDSRRQKLLDPGRPGYARPRPLSAWRLRRI